jgi:hypothetical protein
MFDGEHSVDLVSQSLKDLLAQSVRRQRRYARLCRVLFLVVLDARASSLTFNITRRPDNARSSTIK